MYGFDHGAWMMGGWIVMLALWLLPFALLFLAIKFSFDKLKASGGKRTIDILEASYAGGNISREEFLQKRDDLLKGK